MSKPMATERASTWAVTNAGTDGCGYGCGGS